MWGPYIGDAVNDLRSALDYIVWELTAAKIPIPSDPLPPKWRRIGFPIVADETHWQRAVQTKLWGRSDLGAAFKALQPFVTGEKAPKRESLWVLEELWRIDKHRYPHLTQGIIGASGIRSAVRKAFPSSQRLLEWREPTFKWTVGPDAAMHMDTDLIFEVAFDGGPPA